MNIPVDLRTLRAVRVLRPLKLVSGIPSEFVSELVSFWLIMITSQIFLCVHVIFLNEVSGITLDLR